MRIRASQWPRSGWESGREGGGMCVQGKVAMIGWTMGEGRGGGGAEEIWECSLFWTRWSTEGGQEERR